MTSSTPPVVTRVRAQSKPGPIAFRLDAEVRQTLEFRAGELGVSPHELARHYVIDLLSEAEDRAALREEVTALRSELNVLRADLALAVEALLVSAGKVVPADAHTWVEQNLPPCSPSPTP